MIRLTKLDNSPILVHLSSIKYIEGVADTRVFFMNGDMVIVKETLEEIQNLTVAFQTAVLHPNSQFHSETSQNSTSMLDSLHEGKNVNTLAQGVSHANEIEPNL